MELVYLWVKDYKNIKKQGFNFSSRFRCDYDEEKNKLLICDKEDKNCRKKEKCKDFCIESYIKDFFGEDINVTAIVGKNGSGKSSLIELLMLLFFSSSTRDIENSNRAWILTYNKANDRIDINYFNQENVSFDKIIFNNELIRQNSIDRDNEKYYFYNRFIKREYYNLFYNPSIELVSSSFLSFINEDLKNQDGAIYDLDFKSKQLNIFAFPSKKNRKIDIKKNENNIILTMYKSIEVLNNKNIELELDKLLNNKKLNFIPSKVAFKLDTNQTEYLIKHDNQKIKDILSNKYNNLSLKSLYAYFISFILSVSSEDYESKMLNDYFFKDSEIKNYLQETYIKQKELIPQNNQILPIYKLTEYILENIEEFIKLTENINLADFLKESSKRLNIDIFETAKLIDVLKTLSNSNILNTKQNNIETIVKILPVIPSYIGVDVYDKNNIYFNDYSHGEKNVINLIYSLIYYVNVFSTNNNTINLFIDEIETGLNPKWQRELINILIPFFSKLNISMNVVISTHSPFLLSDIPQQNIIFLDTYTLEDEEVKSKKQNVENCKIIYGLEDKKQTFGANIHTLLSDSFFMEDGLMGEFAKNKINEIIKFLKDENDIYSNEKEKLKMIILSIGEPFLKDKLLRMYDDKYPKTDDEKIAELEAKILRLKNNDKNKN